MKSSSVFSVPSGLNTLWLPQASYSYRATILPAVTIAITSPRIFFTNSNAATNAVVYGSLTFLTGYVGSLVGTAIGSVLPGLGNVIGATVGFAIGTAIGFLLDLNVNGKSIIDHINDAVYNFWTWLFGG